MMTRVPFSAALLLMSLLSLAPQAWVCGTVEKHECSCCGGGNACTCCDIVPLYPDQDAAEASAPRVSTPEAWTPFADGMNPPAGSDPTLPLAVERIHGPPPLLPITPLRI
jgi:hypothetical protein